MRAISTTDPKQLSEKGGDCALFAGTFDLHAKKWLSADARALKQDEYNGAETAFIDLDAQLKDISFATPESKAEWLDDRMNEVYVLVRLMVPAARFATIKREQIEWLKTRDAAHSVEEKSKLTENRIRALQDPLW